MDCKEQLSVKATFSNTSKRLRNELTSEIKNEVESNDVNCEEQRSGKAASSNASTILPDGQPEDLTSGGAKPASLALAMDTTASNMQIETIRKVLSNCYWNVVERLQIKYPSRCVRDLNYCYKHHYNALLPNAPTFSQAKRLRDTLMNQLYLNFVESVQIMCTCSVFPGDGVLTKIIEIILVLVPKNLDATQFQMTYIGTIQLFRLIVCVFPPCWLALRPYYVNLFDAPILEKQGKKKKYDKLSSEPTKIMPLLLKLLENVITECSKDELSKQTNLHAVVEDALVEKEGNNDDNELPTIETTEIMNPYDWGDNQMCLENFYSLSTSERITRLFDVLELLLCAIEYDSSIWLLHHYKKIHKFMFEYDKCPLIVLVCELQKQKRNTEVVNQLFKLYAMASAKGLHKKRLKIIERYISLLFEVSNTADLELHSSGYKYPSLSVGTKKLIHNFFLTFKSHNPSNINNYIQAMTLIGQPYVRFQFIDHFLQMFHFSKTEQLTPKKIAYDLIQRKSWRKYKSRAVLSSSKIDDDISREDYLDLLLNALRAYCKWHDCHSVLNNILHKRDIKPLQTVIESPHRQRQRGGHRLVLKRIEDDLAIINRDINTDALLSMPKVDLPIMDIKIDNDVLQQYRNDLKFMVILAEQLPKEATMYSHVDFSAWLEFLKQFQG